MAATTDIGGFFVNLGLKTDKDSFDKGKNKINDVSNNIAKLVGTVRNAAPVVAAGIGAMFATATASGKIESQELKTAYAIGMSTEALKSWKIAASMAGTNGNALVSGISALDTKIVQMLKNGQSIDEIASSFTRLRLEAGKYNADFNNISAQDFINMDAEQRAKTIFRMASVIPNHKEAALRINELLGGAGSDFYNYMKLTNQNIDSLLSKSDKLNFVDDESAKKATDFNTQLAGTVEAVKSITMLIGGEAGSAFTPMLEQLNTFLGDNKESIKEKIGVVADGFKSVGDNIAPLIGTGLQAATKAIDVMAKALKDLMESPELKELGNTLKKVFGDIAGALGPAFTSAIKTGVDLIKDLSAALSALLTGDWKKTGENLKKFFKDLGSGVADILGINGEKLKEDIVSGIKNAPGELWKAINGKSNVLSNAQKAQTILQKEQKKNIFGANESSFKDYTLETRNVILDGLKSGAISPGDIRQYVKDWNNNDEIKNATKKINDGIVKPDGSVVSVAPDDWVVAFKDVADLASAFIPQSYGNTSNVNAPANYIINQSFSINGNTALMPQTIRQQAYSGTQSGLLEAMQRSQDRLQMMSGLR